MRHDRHLLEKCLSVILIFTHGAVPMYALQSRIAFWQPVTAQKKSQFLALKDVSVVLTSVTSENGWKSSMLDTFWDACLVAALKEYLAFPFEVVVCFREYCTWSIAQPLRSLAIFFDFHTPLFLASIPVIRGSKKPIAMLFWPVCFSGTTRLFNTFPYPDPFLSGRPIFKTGLSVCQDHHQTKKDFFWATRWRASAAKTF